MFLSSCVQFPTHYIVSTEGQVNTFMLNKFYSSSKKFIRAFILSIKVMFSIHPLLANIACMKLRGMLRGFSINYLPPHSLTSIIMLTLLNIVPKSSWGGIPTFERVSLALLMKLHRQILFNITLFPILLVLDPKKEEK